MMGLTARSQAFVDAVVHVGFGVTFVGAGGGIRTHVAPRGHKLLGTMLVSPGLLHTWLGDPGTDSVVQIATGFTLFPCCLN
jgi:hypothetical protein